MVITQEIRILGGIEMKHTKELTLSAMFISIGLILPFLTGQIPQIGRMLLPMHLPVFLCGLICGWKKGAIVGFTLPIMRSILFGMPVMFPMAITMSFELLTYGWVVGLIYQRAQCKFTVAIYRSMLIAMISGRVVWGVVMGLMLGMGENRFTWQMFITGGILNAIPGIIIQLLLIPTIMVMLKRMGFLEDEINQEERLLKCKGW